MPTTVEIFGPNGEKLQLEEVSLKQISEMHLSGDVSVRGGGSICGGGCTGSTGGFCGASCPEK